LVRAAAASLSGVGLWANFDAASTDANYPASKGIPSICVGVTRGGGMHTPDEWIEQRPILQGLRHLLLLTAALRGVKP
jgi:acetylornithine deacetylase/succinyl-diaminopimelate desuccinylase-like protein